MTQNANNASKDPDPLTGIAKLLSDAMINSGAIHEYERGRSAKRTEGTEALRKATNEPDSEDVLGIISLAVVNKVAEDGEPGYVILGGFSGNVDILTGLSLIISERITKMREECKSDEDSNAQTLQ